MAWHLFLMTELYSIAYITIYTTTSLFISHWCILRLFLLFGVFVFILFRNFPKLQIHMEVSFLIYWGLDRMCFFFLLCGESCGVWAIPTSAQRLFLALYSEVALDGMQKLYVVLGIWTRVIATNVTWKARTLPTQSL